MNTEQMREYVKHNKVYPAIEALVRTLVALNVIKDGEWAEFGVTFRAAGEHVAIDEFILRSLEPKETT